MQLISLSTQSFVEEHISTLIVFAGVPVLLFFVIFGFRNYTDMQDKISAVELEVARVNKDVRILQSNQNILENDIDLYNALLSQIVPEQEDYFTIILALEKLTQDTGFLITKFSINPSKSSTDKLSLIVEGKGNSEEFLRFLENYKFSGGRLITNDTISFTSSDANNIKLNLSFYVKKTNPSTAIITQLTDDDIALLNKIKEKTVITIKDVNEYDLNYETKPNPF